MVVNRDDAARTRVWASWTGWRVVGVRMIEQTYWKASHSQCEEYLKLRFQRFQSCENITDLNKRIGGVSGLKAGLMDTHTHKWTGIWKQANKWIWSNFIF